MTLPPRSDLDELALAWDHALTTAGVPPGTRDGTESLARRLARITHAWPALMPAAERVGNDLALLLIEAQATAPAIVHQAILLIGRLPLEPAIVTQIQASLATTHAVAVQRRLLDQQEAIHQAAITARDRAEQALRESEARFRALFGQAPVGIGIGDTRGRILDVNEALQRMFGYS